MATYVSFAEYCDKSGIEPGSQAEARFINRIINMDPDQRRELVKNFDPEKPDQWRINLDKPGKDLFKRLKNSDSWLEKIIILAFLLIGFLIYITFKSIATFITSIKDNDIKWMLLSALGAIASLTLIVFILHKLSILSFEAIFFPAALFIEILLIYGIYRTIRQLIPAIKERNTSQIVPSGILTLLFTALFVAIPLCGLILPALQNAQIEKDQLQAKNNAQLAAETIKQAELEAKLSQLERQQSAPANQCPGTQTFCNGSCIDPLTNQIYCGAYGDCQGYTVCTVTQKCISGKCIEQKPCKATEQFYKQHCIVKMNEPQSPAPSVEERLSFVKSIKNLKTKKVDFLIFNDNFKNTQCLVSMQKNHTLLDANHWCIPMKNIPKDIESSLMETKTHQLMPDIYPYCYNLIKMGSHMPNGLAAFFEKFNPDFYNSKLKHFAENPNTTVYKLKDNLSFYFDPYDTYNVPDRYYKHPLSVVMSINFDYTETGYMRSWEYQTLDTDKLNFIEQNSNIKLHKGDIILTASASKGEKKLHQYWLVASDNLVYATVYDGRVLRPGEESELPMYGMPIVPIYDLKSKEIWQALDAPIQTAMSNLNTYCLAANLSLNNEAINEQWASLPANSPLLKKK